MTHITKNITVEALETISAWRNTPTTQVAAATTTTLSVSSTYLNTFTGTTAGQIVNLGAATQYGNGHRYAVLNRCTQIITIKDGDSVTLFTLLPGGSVLLYLRDNSTTAGIWDRAVSGASSFSGSYPLLCSYSANAGVGRYLEFFPSNPSDASPFLVVAPALIVGMSITGTASSTCTVTIWKNAVSVATLSTVSQTSNSTLSLTVALVANDLVSVSVTSGSINKPGVAIYISNS